MKQLKVNLHQCLLHMLNVRRSVSPNRVVQKPRVLPGGDDLWVLCAALAYFCVPIFLHFVSFQICAADNRL